MTPPAANPPPTTAPMEGPDLRLERRDGHTVLDDAAADQWLEERTAWVRNRQQPQPPPPQAAPAHQPA